MMQVKIVASGKYLPKNKVSNEELQEKFKLEEKYIEKRTGIKNRYYAKEETSEEMAINAVKNLFEKNKNIKKENIGLIIVATTTPINFMPGIANQIQKVFSIQQCNAYDILAGCNGYINAFDIASTYIHARKVKRALVVGVDALSQNINEKDIGTAIILADGAGAILLEATEDEKKEYFSYITSIGENNEILTARKDEYIYMNGKEIYKYAVKEPVNHIKKILEKTDTKIEEIKYIIPHQSNRKIMKSMANRLGLKEEKIYMNIEKIGNTFCASIPIAIDQMLAENLLEEGDKVILLGYGGGLNTGCILLEI